MKCLCGEQWRSLVAAESLKLLANSPRPTKKLKYGENYGPTLLLANFVQLFAENVFARHLNRHDSWGSNLHKSPMHRSYEISDETVTCGVMRYPSTIIFFKLMQATSVYGSPSLGCHRRRNITDLKNSIKLFSLKKKGEIIPSPYSGIVSD